MEHNYSRFLMFLDLDIPIQPNCSRRLICTAPSKGLAIQNLHNSFAYQGQPWQSIRAILSDAD